MTARKRTGEGPGGLDELMAFYAAVPAAQDMDQAEATAWTRRAQDPDTGLDGLLEPQVSLGAAMEMVRHLLGAEAIEEP